MTKNALVVILAPAILGIWGSPVTAQKSGDACALLQATEIQTLAGTAKIGAGRASTDALDSRLCRYEWGSGSTAQAGHSVLDVSVTAIAKAYPGTDAADLNNGLLASVKAGDPNAAVIPAVGDAAIYQSTAPIRGEATAMVKGSLLLVTFESADARVHKDEVIALLKSAAGRL